MGSTSALRWAGPSILLAYIIAGLFIFFIMRVMGEMLYLEPVTGSFATYAYYYLGPFWGYLTAWSYWLMWLAVGIAEITAMGIYVQYWFPMIPKWLPALLGVVLVAVTNFSTVRLYGETEFWFALIKVVTIIVMIVVGIGLIFFGIGNDGQAIGIAHLHLTRLREFFADGWQGFMFALCLVVASYQGVELVGVTAGEAQNPQVTLKRAINHILWRILIFYVGAMFVVVALLPWQELGTMGSPFVLIFARIGVVSAAGIINFVILTAALSGCNSGMYSGGRMLYTLAQNRQLPLSFMRLSPNGVPRVAVAVTLLCLFIGASLNYLLPNPSKVFVYVYSVSVLPGMIPWFVLLFSQHGFRKTHQEALRYHFFKSILFPYVNYLTILFLLGVLIGMGLNPETRTSLCVGGGLLVVVAICYPLFLYKGRPLKHIVDK